MIISNIRYKLKFVFLGVLITQLTLLLTGCSPLATKIQITYHVEFEVDGQDYNVNATNDCYKLWDFGRGDYWLETISKTVIHGSLKDGSRYVVGSRQDYSCNGVGHLIVPSTVFIPISSEPRSFVESFDNIHDHSSHHQVHIKKSFIDFKSDGIVLADVAQKRTDEDAKLMPDAVKYQSVGAKLTPFSNVDEAKHDFYSGDCPKRPDIRMQLGCTDAVFNFHPLDAVIPNTEAAASFDGHAFTLTMGLTHEAVTWFSDPSVICHKMSCGSKGPGDSFQIDQKSDITVYFKQQTFALSPFLDRVFYLDPVSNKVIIIYVDEVNL